MVPSRSSYHDRVRCTRRFLPLLATLSYLCGLPHAQAQALAPAQSAPSADSLPATTLDNTDLVNTTRWGLGAGVGIERSPYVGVGTRFSPLPLVLFDDKWIHFFGETLDIKAPQFYGVTASLRTRFSIGDVYKGSDSPALNGMATRTGAVWVGPALSWHNPYLDVSGEFLFSSKGQQGKVVLDKGFKLGQVRIAPHIGVEYLSSKDVNYYYGVLPNEVTATRAAYNGRATYNFVAGTEFDWSLTPHQTIRADLGLTRYGSGITSSPLVDKKVSPEMKIGYLYTF
jgi:outer membrane protein